MGISIGAEAARLAGLQSDMLQKCRNGQITLDQIEWWLNRRSEVRNRYMKPDFQDVVRGKSQIVAIEHVINCDADPFVPGGWTVKTHEKGGFFKWDASNIRLYLSKTQQGDGQILGHKLCKELEQESVLNANVLDFLLKHTDLIPEEWKGEDVLFWGTIYFDSGGGLYVRCLYWYGGRWGWDCRWLGDGFGDRAPAACSQVSSD